MNAPAPFFADLAEAPPGGRVLWLRAEDGVRIRAALWPGKSGTAVIFSGRTEYLEKYGRMAGALRARGLAVAAVDWRGQGLSDRLGRRPEHGHVAHFGHYQRDWAALATSDAFASLPRPVFLFAHSMGGCIGLRTLLDTHPFAAAVFSAPMWGLHLRTAGRQAAELLARLGLKVGLPLRRGRVSGAEPSPLDEDFPGNLLTSDPEHFGWLARQLTARPELGLGGPSARWTLAALREMAELARAAPPDVPALGFLGSEEAVVSPRAVRRQMARMPRARLVALAGARHEVWMERPAIQRAVWAETDAFLDLEAAAEAARLSAGRA